MPSDLLRERAEHVLPSATAVATKHQYQEPGSTVLHTTDSFADAASNAAMVEALEKLGIGTGKEDSGRSARLPNGSILSLSSTSSPCAAFFSTCSSETVSPGSMSPVSLLDREDSLEASEENCCPGQNDQLASAKPEKLPVCFHSATGHCWKQGPGECCDCQQSRPTCSIDSMLMALCDVTQQTRLALTDFTQIVTSISTHATKLTHSLATAEEAWRESFPVATDESRSDERLRSFFFCNILTSVGRCPGTVFVTEDKIYFASDADMEYNTADDDVEESQYKISVPFWKVHGIHPQANPKDDSERYIQVVTTDNFEFWFTGFINYDSAFAHLLHALHSPSRSPSKT